MSVSTHNSEPEQTDSPETDTAVETMESEGVTAPTPEEPSLDVVFDVLRNRRRRLVLKAIEERDGSTTLSELAEHIGGIENDKPPTALNAQERKRVYVGLYQCHLPRMDDADAIDFDKNRGTVERGAFADTFHTYLERDVQTERNWPQYYVGLAGLSILAFVTSTVVIGTLESGVFLVSLALFGALSLHHWRCETEPETEADDVNDA